MKRLSLTSALLVLALSSVVTAANNKSQSEFTGRTASNPGVRDFTGQIVTGFYSGVGVHCSGTLNN